LETIDVCSVKMALDLSLRKAIMLFYSTHRGF